MKRVGFNHRFKQIDESVHTMVCNFEIDVSHQHPGNVCFYPLSSVALVFHDHIFMEVI
jgi:hypothetical protein